MTTGPKYKEKPIMNELAKQACCLKKAVIFQEPLKKSMQQKDKQRIEDSAMLRKSAICCY